MGSNSSIGITTLVFAIILVAVTGCESGHDRLGEETEKDTITYTIPSRIESVNDYLNTSNVDRFIIKNFINESNGPLKMLVDEDVDIPGKKFIMRKDNLEFTGYIRFNYGDGSLAILMNVFNGNAQGAAMVWYRNGQLYEIVNFDHGLRHGLNSEYYDDGTKMMERNYVNGMVEGFITQWNSEGLVWAQTHLVHGERDGVQVILHRNGMIEFHNTYKNGQPNGWYRRFDENGKLEYEALYENGKIVRE